MRLPDFSYEQSLLPPGTRYLLGLDEVGRGPWAGPVTVGVFLIDLVNFKPDIFHSLKVRDSKLLSPQNRLRLCTEFRNQDYKYAVFSASSVDIDNQGIVRTIVGLIHQSLKYFQGSYDFALIDGNLKIPEFACRSVIKADQDCFSVAAASICAKVERDSKMDKLDQKYPQYGFSSHKGYGTAFHLAALHKYGPCPIHRQSYKPVKNILSTVAG